MRFASEPKGKYYANLKLISDKLFLFESLQISLAACTRFSDVP